MSKEFKPFVLPEKRDDFPSTESILTQLRLAENLCVDLNNARETLHRLLKGVQSHCDHSGLEKVTEFDPHFFNADTTSHGMSVLLGEKCPRCLLFIPRRNGGQSKICFKCGGDMASEGVVPGQGGRLYVYKCKSCGHRYCHS